MKKWDEAMKKKGDKIVMKKGSKKAAKTEKIVKTMKKDGNAIKRSKYDEKRGQKK